MLKPWCAYLFLPSEGSRETKVGEGRGLPSRQENRGRANKCSRVGEAGFQGHFFPPPPALTLMVNGRTAGGGEGGGESLYFSTNIY